MMNPIKSSAAGVVAALALDSASQAAENNQIDILITQLKSSDPKVRTQAWLAAGETGSAAVKPLATLMVDQDLEVARAGKRALWRIVRESGRPGANRERRAATRQLLNLLAEDRPLLVRVEVIRMLSEIGGNNAVPLLTELLRDLSLREDARQALQRIPGPKSVAALQAALEFVPEDFQTPVASALRARGVQVPGHPCHKLTPTKQTKVVPAGRA